MERSKDPITEYVLDFLEIGFFDPNDGGRFTILKQFYQLQHIKHKVEKLVEMEKDLGVSLNVPVMALVKEYEEVKNRITGCVGDIIKEMVFNNLSGYALEKAPLCTNYPGAKLYLSSRPVNYKDFTFDGATGTIPGLDR